MVDSGATEHYLDDELVRGLRDKIMNYRVLKTPRIIPAPGMHKLGGTVTGEMAVHITDSNAPDLRL